MMTQDKRVVFYATPALMSKLESLKCNTSAASWSEVIRRAVRTYNLLHEISATGAEMYTIYPDGTKKQLILV